MTGLSLYDVILLIMTRFVLNITDFFCSITEFVLRMMEFVLIMTGGVQNTSIFFLNLTVCVLKGLNLSKI